VIAAKREPWNLTEFHRRCIPFCSVDLAVAFGVDAPEGRDPSARA
jgi:hypothetical protein